MDYYYLQKELVFLRNDVFSADCQEARCSSARCT